MWHEDRHPTGRELKEVAGFRAEPRLVRQVTKHLEVGCEICEEVFAELLADKDLRACPPRYAESRWTEEWTDVADQEKGEARRRLGELEGLTREQQLVLIRGAQRFRKLSLVSYLCGKSRELLGNDPERSLELGQLAVTVAEELDPARNQTGLVEDVLARAWLRLAEAQQRASHPAASAESIERAERILRGGTGDPLELAELCFTRGSLYMEQGQLDEALDWLGRAANLFDDLREPTEAGKALAHQGVAYAEAGRLDDAIRKVIEASLMMEDKTAHLSLMVLHNIALYMTEAGRLKPALAIVSEARPLYEEAGKRSGVLRRLWLEGMILVRLGRTEEGLEKFARAREGFFDKGWVLEAARVTLEETLHSDPLRRKQLIRLLIEQMLPILRSRGLHREALAAVHLLDESLKESALNLAIEAAIEVLRTVRLGGKR